MVVVDNMMKLWANGRLNKPIILNCEAQKGKILILVTSQRPIKLMHVNVTWENCYQRGGSFFSASSRGLYEQL